MVDNQRPEDTNPDLARSLRKSGVENNRARESGPIYRVMGSSKIPVAKSYGPLWKSRKDAGLSTRKRNGLEEAWDEALKYYNNDQLRHRTDGDPDVAGNASIARRRNRRFSETENIVFANTRTLVPTLYARNPRVEITTHVEGADEEKEQARRQATLVERVVNAVIRKRNCPGINLKPKARRAVVMSSLTNRAWIEIGYTHRQQSSDEALREIQELALELQQAKDSKKIKEIEGKLQSVEQKVDILSPPGPWAKYRRPHDVVVDPDALEEDASDANWLMVTEYLPTQYILAMYAVYDAEQQKHKSIYEPTHIVAANEGTDNIDDLVNNFSLINDEADYKKYGFGDEYSFKKAQRTKVWWVWDKVTRRLFLYNDKDWSWPLWVWDDPYKLEGFFPLYPLSFYTDPECGESKGEVTYYLDQQDAINEINDEERRARLSLRTSPMYNKNVIKPEDFERWLNGDFTKGCGVDIPEGQSISDHIFAPTPPSMNFPQMFNVDNKLRAVDRIASTNDVMRGAQLKSHTTEDAVELMSGATNTILDEKTDAVEDFIGRIGWGLAQLCLQFMEQQEVATLIGQTASTQWQRMGADEIQTTFGVEVVGGSTAKPTSRAKKREALEIGQVLGQYVQVSPVVLEVTLKSLEQAFDEITVSEEDWQILRQSIAQVMQQAQMQGQSGQQPTQGGEQQGVGAEQIAQLVDNLPPEAKQALGTAIAQGVPVQQALEQIIRVVAQRANGEQVGVTGNA